MMKSALSFLIYICSFGILVGQSSVTIGERYVISSKALNEQRHYQVYLPLSYHQSPDTKYPVLYMIDGDYNFHYVTGLIDHLSHMSGKIPEMIVVGISDKGKNQYRKNMSPVDPDNPDNPKNGRATQVMDFIKNELQPTIEAKYKVADYKILMGHSIGGLFTVAAFGEQPDLADAYIAISPSIWWGGYFMNKKTETALKANPELQKSLYISLGDERGMGVYGLVDVLDKYAPAGLHWVFNYMPNESHGSIAVPSIKKALLDIFKDWTVSRETFYGFKNAQEAVDHYKKINDTFGMFLPVPESNLGNMVYFYHRKKQTQELLAMEKAIQNDLPVSLADFYGAWASEQLLAGDVEKAKENYQKAMHAFPNHFGAKHGLALIYKEQKSYKQAAALMEQVLDLAKKQHMPQWKMNELESDTLEIKNAMN